MVCRLLDRFSDRIEPIDLTIPRKWADVSVKFPSLRDGDKAIAAAAIAKGYRIATGNILDFRAAGVAVVDPFDRDTWDEDCDDDPLAPFLRP